MTKILICGAGGFIGGHLASNFLRESNIKLVCVDIKPYEYWFQNFDNSENYTLDLKEFKNAIKVTKDIDYIFNFACNMGGMGFIENNKAECMLSVLVNTNLLRAAIVNKCKKFFFSSSACVYNSSKQSKTFVNGLKEEDAYPADPERSVAEQSQGNERDTNPVNEDSDEIKETASWVELLESGGLSQDMFLPIFGILVLLLFTKIGLSSRKIKKLKQELQELSESKSAWERLDLDEDGELSDLELEAYKLIRDKGKQPDANEEATQSAEISNDENAPFQASEFVDDSTNDWLMDELG